MAYEKQTWACGDTITAEKLNHMESGIASGGVYELTIEKEGDYYVIPGEQVKAIVDDFPALVKAPAGWLDGGSQFTAHYTVSYAEEQGIFILTLFLAQDRNAGFQIVAEQMVVYAESYDSVTNQHMFMYDAESNTYRCAIEG